MFVLIWGVGTFISTTLYKNVHKTYSEAIDRESGLSFDYFTVTKMIMDKKK